jgi:hypothetical protein
MTSGKPTIEGLGIDVSAARWQRSGAGDGAIEVALVGPAGEADPGQAAEWVLMRVAGDAGGPA